MAWWHWMALAVLLGIVEVFVPGYMFLGFASGAAALGLLFLAGGPLAGWLSGSLAPALVAFALLSLVSWVVLRRLFGSAPGQRKIWKRDIND